MEIQTSPPAHKQFVDESTAEGQIRQLIEDLAEAVLEKNIDRILSAYAPDAVIYDAQDGLENDKQALRKKWEEHFQTISTQEFEYDEVSVIAEENVAFSHFLCHTTGISKLGLKIDNWIQVTDCFSKIDEEWKIVHEHVSMPLEHSKFKS